MAYTYQPLDKGTQIRLLEIQPLRVTTKSPFSLQTYNLSHLPSFEAISYTWGSSDLDKSIICNGKRLPVTSNCATMLHYLRLEAAWARRVWIDQICVNQKDIPERNDQVVLMTEIYSRAQQVIAWLGESSEIEKKCLALVAKVDINSVRYDSKSLIMGIRSVTDEALEEAKRKIDDIEMLLAGDGWAQQTLKGILDRPYFYRMWILQEATVARRVTVKCGKCSIDMQCLMDLADFMIRWLWLGAPDYLHIISSLHTFRSKYRTYGTLDADSFEELFFRTREYRATDLRDKIYALRGVCRNLRENTQPPDYSKSDVEVYIEAARASITTEQGRLTMLSEARSPRHGADLPTWCPDYGGPVWIDGAPVDPSTTLREKSKRPSSLPIIDGRRLVVRGKIVDSIAKISEAAKRRVAGDLRLVPAFETWRSWLSFMQPASSSYGDESIHMAFWRTLFNDTEGHLTPQAVLKDEKAMRSLTYVEALHARLMEIEPGEEPKLADWLVKRRELYFDVVAAVVRNIGSRACITNEKFFGLVPDYAEVGDLVVYLQGAEKLQLLRPRDPTRRIFSLVKTCYIHGLANGERYPSEDSDLTEIVVV
ncbi:hypothetical protein VPNG_07294 [Cytospora leucostoma]|uniref:Heterokaryon incompatibility domain-containing protein n=1 Tax=Cytospora leucostoma TaxID=1230097 RepID=A0A423WL06_9PEZI|nr:hypothetical protein VPNG_07294 [Cytospora leucostoma]